MYQDNIQQLHTAPVNAVDAGTGWYDQGKGFLGDALDVWGKIEGVKAKKQASGGDLTQAKFQPEHENGAGIVREAPQVSPNIKVGGMAMNKNILIATVALVGGLFAFKVLR